MPAKLIILLTLVIGGSWSYLFYQSWQMGHLPMTEMWMPPSRLSDWNVSDFSWIFIMWAIMMAAMMLPSTIPTLNAFSRYCRRDTDTSEWRTLWFASGYLAAWLLFSIVLTLLQWLFHGWAWLSPMMDNRQPMLAAVIVLLAGIYQFTAFKNACLHHCRSPFGYLLARWQAGDMGALRIGFHHGSSCLGCCWAQMLLMFAVGVMNIGGMVFITLLVIAEKWAPVEGNKLKHGLGLCFLLWGVYILLPIVR